MKILYVITGLTVGGAEIVTIDIANGMAERGHTVKLVALNNRDELSGRILPSVEVSTLNMGKSPLSFVQSAWKLRKVIKAFRPDVVHANMVHANIFTRLVRLFTRMPLLISSAHSNNEGGALRMWAYRLTDFLSDINTNVSDGALDWFVKNKWFSKKKSISVYNGINLDKFHRDATNRLAIREKYNIASTDFLFLFVGRLIDLKDIPNLIKAFGIVSTQVDNVRLLIVGDGEVREEMEQMASEMPFASKITFAGKQTQTNDYYNAADCFVLSSECEGFGMVLVEAMACGLPVVATDAGGCLEVVGDRQYVAEPKDSEQLAKIMLSVVKLAPEDLARLKETNSQRSSKFSLQTILDRWEKIYGKKC